MAEMQNKDSKKRARPGWIACGLALSLLISGLYMACYGLFRARARTVEEFNPLVTQETADWLMAQTYVLYHQLCAGRVSGEMSYLDQYVIPRQGCEWILDEKLYCAYVNGETEGDEDEGLIAETGGETVKLPGDSGRVYSYLNYLQEYFMNLENQFSQINSTFDYFCEDLGTGETVTNLYAGNEVELDEQYFYLAFVFDGYGNCKVENVLCGEDSTGMRKLANEAARTGSLSSNAQYIAYNDAAPFVGLDTYFTHGGPVNCRVVYSISKADWARMEQNDFITLYDKNYSFAENVYSPYIYSGIYSGLGQMLMLLGLVMAVLGMFLPIYISKAPGSDSPGTRLLRMSPESLCGLGFAWIGISGSFCVELSLAVMIGHVQKVLSQSAYQVDSVVLEIVVYAVNLLLLMVTFFAAWYIGLNMREIRRLGPWKYIRERSLIYRFFPFMKSKVLRLYDTVSHFNVTRNANKLIIKLVLINGIILFVISSLWFGGFGIAAVYSLLLYIVLRKYVSDLQKKYGLLLHATNEIAEGNLNVHIKEDLGVFEPFKPQVYRIQNGFKNAVEAEVKSQRMKAELITNVSHDLKTPLTAIITYINLLKEENLTEEQRKEYLNTLERKSMRLKVLIEDLFEVSKASSQSMTLNIMDVDIMNLVRQVAFEMGDKIAERNLDMRLMLPEEKVILPLDSQRTYRVYENLFGNIAKYAMPGTRVYVNGILAEEQVIIMLKNITEEEISVRPEELTDRFVRGDASRNTEGSGLGLAIAKSFVEMQGGELEIEMDGDLFKVTTIWHTGG